MTRDSTDAAPGADTPAQGVTLSIPTHMAAPSHALVLREGPKPLRFLMPGNTCCLLLVPERFRILHLLL